MHPWRAGGDLNLAPSGDITRKTLFEMISEELKIKMNEISDLDFEVDPRDSRLIVMRLSLVDGTGITIPLIDNSATKEE